MKHIQIIPAAVMATLLQACATPPSASSGGVGLSKEQVAIPFMNQGTAINSFQADGSEGLWIQDARREWYYAKLITPCFGLQNAVRLGFDTRGTNKLDRFSYVIVPDYDERCAFDSFTRSDPPPEGKRRRLDTEEVKQ